VGVDRQVGALEDGQRSAAPEGRVDAQAGLDVVGEGAGRAVVDRLERGALHKLGRG